MSQGAERPRDDMDTAEYTEKRTLFVSGIPEDLPKGGREVKRYLASAFAKYNPRSGETYA